MNLPHILLCIPTYNAEKFIPTWLAHYQEQTLQAEFVYVIDSSSNDKTLFFLRQLGFEISTISQKNFNHGSTRNKAVKLAKAFIEADIFVFMTQDAILASPDSLEELVKPFSDPQVAAVYGRQLPHKDATPLAKHARLFNYPDQSRIRTRQDISELGIKCAFMSNSFAAYRRSVFEELGGFPENVILGEDMHLAARMILAGYKIAYSAEATVYHSHNYSLQEEFRRYFDIGVFQQNENWIQKQFGSANSEGKRFVFSELSYVLKNAPHLLPKSILSIMFKWAGFKLGYHWKKLPYAWCKKFTMHKNYWK